MTTFMWQIAGCRMGGRRILTFAPACALAILFSSIGCGGSDDSDNCTPNWVDISECDCTPTECDDCTGTKQQSDSCGETRDASCTESATGCEGIQVCHEGACCTPATACPELYQCGDFPDGCGGNVNCGECTLPETCGSGDTPHVCCYAGPYRERYGVGQATQNMQDGSGTIRIDAFDSYGPGDNPFNILGIGWYFNWSWRMGTAYENIDYSPLVGGWSPGVHPTLETIQTTVAENPEIYRDGTTWLIGNEIIWDDERTPEMYAADYHEFYYGLKAINPTFLVAAGSVITTVNYNTSGFTGTPYELMDAIRAAYQTLYNEEWPVDVYNIHPYIWIQQGDTVQDQLDRFETELSTFRDYMVSIGEQDKPLIITEYGLLNYHDEQWMIDYLLGSFDILESTGHANGMPGDEGRWVQKWAWFVMNNHVWSEGGPVQWDHCKLFDGITFQITPLGQAYASSWQ